MVYSSVDDRSTKPNGVQFSNIRHAITFVRVDRVTIEIDLIDNRRLRVGRLEFSSRSTDAIRLVTRFLYEGGTMRFRKKNEKNP